jgi:hypothetical protein
VKVVQITWALAQYLLLKRNISIFFHLFLLYVLPSDSLEGRQTRKTSLAQLAANLSSRPWHHAMAP